MGSDKQPLLANGSETKHFSRQRLGKQVPAATNKYATIETVFSTRSVQTVYKEESLMEEGSNTFTVDLRVQGGDEK
jgi:hypothetical protein